MDSTTYTLTTSSGDTGSALAGVFIMYLILIVLFAIPSLIVTWKLYAKAGKPGWASIVPIYNVFVELQIAKLPTWYILLFFVPVVSIFVALYTLIKFAEQYDRGLGFWLAYIFVPIVALFMVGKASYAGDGVVMREAATTSGPVPVPAPAENTATEPPIAPVVATTAAPAEPAAETNDGPAIVADAATPDAVEQPAEGPELAAATPKTPAEEASPSVIQQPTPDEAAPTEEEPAKNTEELGDTPGEPETEADKKDEQRTPPIA